MHLADPAKMLPFQRLKQVPCHDEPSVGSTSWGQFAEAVNVARRAGAGVLLNGHGGDLARDDEAEVARFRELHGRLHAAARAVVEASDGEIRYLE